MMHSCVLRVSGIPTNQYEDDLLLDKLLIHFLRRKNGGNGDADVRYPTEERGVAMLTLYQVEVAEQVLTQSHLLEIGGRTYPIEVSSPQSQGTQFSMPITTILSLKYFDDNSEVMALLKKHGLKICEEKSSCLLIKGDFQDLSRCRDDLYKTMSNSSHHVENRMSRKDQYHATEYSSDTYRVSREEASKQSTIKSLPDKSLYKTSNRNPSPRRTKTTPEPVPAENDGYGSTGDRSRAPYIKPSLRSDGFSQRRPKDTSSDDSTSIKKHPKCNIAANLNLYPAPPKKLPADEDRKTGKNSPLPSNGRTVDSSGLVHHTFTSTQFREDLPESRQLKNTFTADSSSSQSKPKGTIADGFTSNPKYPNSTIRDGSDFKPGQPKNISTDELNSDPQHSKSTIGDSTKFNSEQLKYTSTDEFRSNRIHSKSTIGDGTEFSSGQLKKTSTDELMSKPNHSKSTIRDDTKFSSAQPKNTSTGELSSNPNYSKRTIEYSTKFNSGQPKNTSADEINSNASNSQSTIGDSTKFISGQPNDTSTDELRSKPNYSKSANGDSTKFNPGQPNNISPNELISNPNHFKNTIGDGSRFISGQPKNTSTDELNSHPKHSKSTIEDNTKCNPVQPKNTSINEIGSSTNPSKSTIRDRTKFNSGQPKNTSTDELNENLKHSKSTLEKCANFKPGKPQNYSPDDFHLNSGNPKDLTAQSSNRSSLMAAGSSSSSSPTGNSLTTINPKNHLDESLLSTELFVDPEALTYASAFMKDKISDILGPSDAEMKTEAGEGYTMVILTTKSPHLSQHFYKAAREMSDIFIKCQQLLRVQSIDLSNVSTGVTKTLQSYLYYSGIWSLANEKRLQMIGPSENITRFMEKWTSAGGDFARFVPLVQEGFSPGSSRPPVVGMDNVHQSTAHRHNVVHDVHSQRARSRHRSEEPGARGGSRGPDTTSRSKTPSNKPWR